VITDLYDISVRQILQQVLPPQPNALPTCPATFTTTAVFAYGPANVAGQPFHNWPGYTIETQVGRDGHSKAQHITFHSTFHRTAQHSTFHSTSRHCVQACVLCLAEHACLPYANAHV